MRDLEKEIEITTYKVLETPWTYLIFYKYSYIKYYRGIIQLP